VLAAGELEAVRARHVVYHEEHRVVVKAVDPVPDGPSSGAADELTDAAVDRVAGLPDGSVPTRQSVAMLRRSVLAIALAAVAACSSDDGGGSGEVDPVRYECPDRPTAIEVVGDFASLIIERGLQDQLSVADVDLRVQMVPSTAAEQEVVESLRPDLDAIAGARSCSPF
jgi:hypothetical protein